MFNNIKKYWEEADGLLKDIAKAFILSIFLILFLPFIFTRISFTGITFEHTGQIGDTIGGTLGPFVAIVAAGLTFFAFWVQYSANKIQIKNIKDQKKNFNKQQKLINIQRFENKYFEMIKLHNDIVMKIENGKEYFINSYRDLNIIYNIVYTHLNQADNEDVKKYNNIITDNLKMLNVAYLIYWYGNGLTALIGALKQVSPNLDAAYLKSFFTYINELEKKDKSETNITIGDENIPKEDIPEIFRGRSDYLGHYYRNLFQTVKYVDKSEILDGKEKYNYVKTLRAQLSNHEQILLYYNSLTSFGYPWLNDDVIYPHPTSYVNGYLIKYKMIKNIPLPLADIAIGPKEMFSKTIEEMKEKQMGELFEWKEIEEIPIPKKDKDL